MMDIKKKYEYYFTYDKPIPFKKDLFIYPIKMNEYFEFYNVVGCLTIEQNKISDPNIISMSYLDFLFFLINNDKKGEDFKYMLVKIINMCLKTENIRYTDNNGKIKLFINEVEINKKDFDFLKRIICYQNTPDYDDTYIDPELEQALREANELQNSNNGLNTSLERQMSCVVASTSYTYDMIYDMTIRKFILLLQVVDTKLHYQIYKTAECSGMVSFKTAIPHWRYDKNNKFDSLIKYDSFKDKMKHAT